MNKLGLSLSILSLCWFISTTGWGEGFVFNNSFSSPKAIPDNTPTQDQQSIEEDQQSVKEMPLPPPPDLKCGETITITDSEGKITTIKKTCDDKPSPPLFCCLKSKGNNH